MTLTAERLRQLLDYDPKTGIFTWRVRRGGKARAGSQAGRVNAKGYVVICVDGVEHMAQRLAWLWMKGVWPPSTVDHENRKRADNRWRNLRAATSAEQQQNRGASATSTSRHLGVSWHKKARRWQALIAVDGRKFWLGLHDTEAEASAAYRGAKRIAHRFQPTPGEAEA